MSTALAESPVKKSGEKEDQTEAILRFDTPAGRLQILPFRVRNTEDNVIFYKWQRCGASSSLPLKDWRVFVLDKVVGSILPGEEEIFYFAFKAPVPGLFIDHYYLLRQPPPNGHSDPFSVTLQAKSRLIEHSLPGQQRLVFQFGKNVMERIVRDIIWDVIYDVDTIIGPEIPFDVDRSLFQFQNRRHISPRLFFTPTSLNWWTKMLGVLHKALQIKTEDAQVWDYNVKSVFYLVNLIMDEECRDLALKLYRQLIFYSSFPFTNSLSDVEGEKPPVEITLERRHEEFKEKKSEDERRLSLGLEQQDLNYSYNQQSNNIQFLSNGQPTPITYSSDANLAVNHNNDNEMGNMEGVDMSDRNNEQGFTGPIDTQGLDEATQPFGMELEFVKELLYEVTDEIPRLAVLADFEAEKNNQESEQLVKHKNYILGLDIPQSSFYAHQGQTSLFVQPILNATIAAQTAADLAAQALAQAELEAKGAKGKSGQKSQQQQQQQVKNTPVVAQAAKGGKPQPTQIQGKGAAQQKGAPSVDQKLAAEAAMETEAKLQLELQKTIETVEMRMFRFNQRHTPLHEQIHTKQQRRAFLSLTGCEDISIAESGDSEADGPLTILEDEIDATIIDPVIYGGLLNPLIVPHEFFLSFFATSIEQFSPMSAIPNSSQSQSELINTPSSQQINTPNSSQGQPKQIDQFIQQSSSVTLKHIFDHECFRYNPLFTYSKWTDFYQKIINDQQTQRMLPPILHRINYMLNECVSKNLTIQVFCRALDGQLGAGLLAEDDLRLPPSLGGNGDEWAVIVHAVVKAEQQNEETDSNQGSEVSSTSGESRGDDEDNFNEGVQGGDQQQGRQQQDGDELDLDTELIGEDGIEGEPEPEVEEGVIPFEVPAKFTSAHRITLRRYLNSGHHWRNEFHGPLLTLAVRVKQKLSTLLSQGGWILRSQGGRAPQESLDASYTDLSNTIDQWLFEHGFMDEEEEENEEGEDGEGWNGEGEEDQMDDEGGSFDDGV